MQLVEIIRGRETGERALAKAIDFVRQIGKTPIVVNDSRGFFTSRVVMTYLAEGCEMLAEGVPARFNGTVWNFSKTWVLWQSSQQTARDAARSSEKRCGTC